MLFSVMLPQIGQPVGQAAVSSPSGCSGRHVPYMLVQRYSRIRLNRVLNRMSAADGNWVLQKMIRL
ncbi:hypothetical protein HMPREF9413_0259 [Paenibacillus sp. HGF7]|nr:hypothetical protein HMPREF9413_0259 [Paenibacillus sp. HGF7]